MGRRGENIHKRQDGRWEARVIRDHTPDGKARYRYLYGKTYAEARAKRNTFLAEMQTESARGPEGRKDGPFGLLLQDWLRSRKSAVKESTYLNYTYLVDNYIRPRLGDCRISQVSTGVIDDFLKAELESGRRDGTGGLAPKTVGDIRSVVLLALDYGQRRNYACRVDGRVFSPKVAKPAIRVLTEGEQRRLEQVLFSSREPLCLGVLVALYGGLRIGEVCALQWGDISTSDATLRVTKTVMRIQDRSPEARAKTKVVITSPKTASSIRTVPIPAFLAEYLEAFRRDGACYLLTGTTRLMEPRLCLDRYKRLLKAAGLEDLTFHTLRHTYATRCVDHGVDIKSLSEILGHSNVSTTLQRYVHPSMAMKKSQVNRLSELTVWSQTRGHELGKSL